MRSILLSGYYGFGNTGDEAILTATVKALRKASPHVKIMVLSRTPEDTSKTYGVESFQRMCLSQVLSAMKRSDLVVFGGGSLLQDATSFRSLLYYLSIIYLARLFSKPLVVYANGIGPIRSTLGKFLTKLALSTARKITVRDKESKEELLKMGVVGEITVTADPAFLLSPSSHERVDSILESAGMNGSSRIVWIVLREIEAPSWFYPQILSLISFLKQKGFCPGFLLMQEKDRKIADLLNNQLLAQKEKTLPIVSGLTPEEALGILARANFCLGMRLHTLILSARALIPFMGIEIDPKIGAFCRATGCPVLPFPKNPQNFDLLEAFEALIRERKELVRKLERNLPQFQALARENIRMILSLI